MDIHAAIEAYEDAVRDQLEMQRIYDEQRRLLLAAVQPDLDALEVEMRPYLQGYADQVEQTRAEAVKLVLAQGETASGRTVQFVYNKGKTTWDGQMLQGMEALLPQLEKAKRVGQPGVSVRQKD